MGQPATLTCKTSHLERTLGGTDWFVFGCGDNLVVTAARGNPAAPFYFILFPQADKYGIQGEGTGDKNASDAAYKDLAALSKSEVAALLAEANRL